MKLQTLQISFFIILVAVASAMTFFIFLPYLSAIFLAIILAVVFKSLHVRILKMFGNREALSALVSMLVIFVVIVLPVVFFGILLFQEVTDIYAQVSKGGDVGFLKTVIESAQGYITALPGVNIDISQYVDVDQYSEQVLGWLIKNLNSFFGRFFRVAIGFFLMILGLYYVLKDGKKLTNAYISMSPLPDEYDKKILARLEVAVNSVIKGRLAIAVLQGIAVGIGFALFTVPNPLLWGFVAVIAAILPIIGPSLIVIPAVLFLFFGGNLAMAIGLFTWGVFTVSFLDDILGPIFIERGIKIHPLIILISVLGGIAVFGFVGFIAGPVVLSLMYALVDIYPFILKKTTEGGVLE